MNPIREPFDRSFLVPLDADHPGFRDPAYRARRDTIARIALAHRSGADVPDAPYVDEEHAVWRWIQTRLRPLHEQHVCRALREESERLGLSRTGIPQLATVNAQLARATGFRMEPVAGLIEARRFLVALGDGVFLSTQYIRHASRPDYTPEPDVVHELVGHAASLTHPGIAELNRRFGHAARNTDDETLEKIERVYWFTLEFGVVLEDGTPKALGAGLLSSAEELSAMCDGPELIDLDLDAVANTDYDPTRPQERLYVAPTLGKLIEELTAWLATL